MKRLSIAKSGLTLTCVGAFCLSAGCSAIRARLAGPTKPVTPPPADGTVLAAADQPDPQAEPRGRQVSDFGDLPNRSDVPYFSRTAASLLRHTFAQEGSDFDPSLAPDGHWLVFASTRHNVKPDLYYKQVDGVAVTQLTSDPSSDIQPAISPDGMRVAFASDRSGNWDIWVVSLDGMQPVQITSSGSDEVHPSWSSDGTKIVYCSLPPQGQWELWIADATTGGGNARFIGYGLFPEWSPVGDTIVYQRARERGSRWFSIWTMQLVSGEPRYPTEIAASADAALITPSWSRDGAKIAYATVTPAAAEPGLGLNQSAADIWVVDAQGRGRMRLTDGHTANYGPAWSPAHRVYFTSDREGHEAVWSLLPEFPASGATAASGNDDPATARTASGR